MDLWQGEVASELQPADSEPSEWGESNHQLRGNFRQSEFFGNTRSYCEFVHDFALDLSMPSLTLSPVTCTITQSTSVQRRSSPPILPSGRAVGVNPGASAQQQVDAFNAAGSSSGYFEYRPRSLGAAPNGSHRWQSTPAWSPSGDSSHESYTILDDWRIPSDSFHWPTAGPGGYALVPPYHTAHSVQSGHCVPAYSTPALRPAYRNVASVPSSHGVYSTPASQTQVCGARSVQPGHSVSYPTPASLTEVRSTLNARSLPQSRSQSTHATARSASFTQTQAGTPTSQEPAAYTRTCPPDPPSLTAYHNSPYTPGPGDTKLSTEAPPAEADPSSGELLENSRPEPPPRRSVTKTKSGADASRSYHSSIESRSLASRQFDSRSQCEYCNATDHAHIWACPEFETLIVSERFILVEGMNLCQICLSRNHEIGECSSKHPCRECGGMHHSLLHRARPTPAPRRRNQTNNPTTPRIPTAGARLQTAAGEVERTPAETPAKFQGSGHSTSRPLEIPRENHVTLHESAQQKSAGTSEKMRNFETGEVTQNSNFGKHGNVLQVGARTFDDKSDCREKENGKIDQPNSPCDASENTSTTAKYSVFDSESKVGGELSPACEVVDECQNLRDDGDGFESASSPSESPTIPVRIGPPAPNPRTSLTMTSQVLKIEDVEVLASFGNAASQSHDGALPTSAVYGGSESTRSEPLTLTAVSPPAPVRSMTIPKLDSSQSDAETMQLASDPLAKQRSSDGYSDCPELCHDWTNGDQTVVSLWPTLDPCAESPQLDLDKPAGSLDGNVTPETTRPSPATPTSTPDDLSQRRDMIEVATSNLAARETPPSLTVGDGHQPTISTSSRDLRPATHSDQSRHLATGDGPGSKGLFSQSAPSRGKTRTLNERFAVDRTAESAPPWQLHEHARLRPNRGRLKSHSIICWQNIVQVQLSSDFLSSRIL